MRHTLGILIAVCCLAIDGSQPIAVARTVQSSDHQATVRAFVDAFNARAIDDMLRLATEDIEWVSVDGVKIAAEATGREALRRSMSAYFASCPTCRSRTEIGVSTPSRVTAVETATWRSAADERSQRSVSVYEFSGARIRRVYYFPAER